MDVGISSMRSRECFLPRDSGGGHLAACNAEHRVVGHDGSDLFASGGDMDSMCGSDGGDVPVALIGENHPVRTGALDACSYGLGPAVGCADKVAAEKVKGKTGAADRRHADCFTDDIQFLQDFSDQTVNDAVGTARTVMKRGSG